MKPVKQNQLKLQKMAYVNFFKAKRAQHNKISICNSSGQQHEVEVTHLSVKGTNKEGEGVVVAINNSGAIYIEQISYYEGLADLLAGLDDFLNCFHIPSSPAPTTSPLVVPNAGTVSPNVAEKAFTLSQKIQKLKSNLP